jgi:hypothetical protein
LHLAGRGGSQQEPLPCAGAWERKLLPVQGIGSISSRVFGKVGVVLETYLGLSPSWSILLPVPDSLTLESGLLTISVDAPLLSC